MSLDKRETTRLIMSAIRDNRNEVINAINNSNIGVDIDDSVSDIQLYRVIVSEIRNGNGFMLYNIRKVVSGTEEEKSNWISAVVAAATTLYGVYQGDKAATEAKEQLDKQTFADNLSKAEQQAMMLEKMEIYRANAIREGINADLTLEAKKEKSKRTIISLSIIGGVIIIGAITTVLILKKK